MSEREFRYRASAVRDLDGCAAYLQQEAGEGVAMRFVEAATATFLRLLELPEVGRWRAAQSPALEGCRSLAIQGFENHIVFYRPIETGVEVLRVLHGARDLGTILGIES